MCFRLFSDNSGSIPDVPVLPGNSILINPTPLYRQNHFPEILRHKKEGKMTRSGKNNGGSKLFFFVQRTVPDPDPREITGRYSRRYPIQPSGKIISDPPTDDSFSNPFFRYEMRCVAEDSAGKGEAGDPGNAGDLCR
jgi:hypothetical protein